MLQVCNLVIAVLIVVVAATVNRAVADSDSDAKSALALALASATRPTATEVPSPTAAPIVRDTSYASARAKALATGKRLIVWVGESPRDVPNCINCACETFPEFVGSGAIVAVPRDGKLLWESDLPGRPTVAQIEEVIQSRRGQAATVSVAPTYFGGGCANGICGIPNSSGGCVGGNCSIGFAPAFISGGGGCSGGSCSGGGCSGGSCRR